MSDLGLLSLYLGIEVQQDSNGVSLCQAHYAARIIQLGSKEGCNSAHTPMEEQLKLTRVSTLLEEHHANHYVAGTCRQPLWSTLQAED